MPTANRTRGGRRKTAAPAREPTAAEAADPTIDAAMEQWTDQATQDLAAWGLGASTAFMRSLQALQEVQLDAARETFKLQEQAVSQLASAHGATDVAQLQLALAQGGGQVAMQSMARIGEVATRQAFDAWKEVADGWGRFQGAAWTAAAQWLGGVSRQAPDPELIEAEVEHVVSPLAASPFVWPVQEASRQAMTLASSAWNDWLTMSNRLAESGWGAGARR
jgi:hypothetical protein